MVYFYEKNDLRDKAIKAINETTFYPNKGKDRILSMIEGKTRLVCFSTKSLGSTLTNFYK